MFKTLRTILGLAPLFAGLSAVVSAAAAWRPVPGHIMTRWAKDVSPAMAWPEYPRPQLVRRDWQSLNGLWDYAIVGEDGPWTKPMVVNATFDPLLKELPAEPRRWEGKILVPFAVESALSGVGQLVRPNQLLWYRRRFEVPAAWQGRRVLLHFEAVDWHCVALVNGQKAGENKGGYVPFSFDITPGLKPAGPQEIRLAVWDSTGDQAVGKQSLPESRKGWRYTPTTGIWQAVWLEPVPETSIAGLRLTPDVDRGRLAVEVSLQGPNAVGNGLRAVPLNAERHGGRSLQGAADEEIELRAFDGETLVATARGPAEKPLALEMPQPKLWSPESPFVYDLTVSLRRGGKTIDEVRSYFAMRKIAVAKDAGGVAQGRLNGREIFSFGPLDQGYWPEGILTPPSDAAARSEVQYLRDIGCNLVRVHVTMHPARWYYWCDKLGLMVWQDFVSRPKMGSSLTPASMSQWESEQARMIDNLQNHPAIVMWVLFNEGWGQYDSERLARWVHERDPSRLVDDGSGCDAGAGNVLDVHNYAFLPCVARPGQLGDRAMLLGECGGFNVAVAGHTWYSPRLSLSGTTYPWSAAGEGQEVRAHLSTRPYSGEGQGVRAEVFQESRHDPLGGEVRESFRDAASWADRYAVWIENLRLLRYLGLSGAVYTQISDVEQECNGWMTYDRQISKIPVQRLKALHQRLFAPLELKTIALKAAAGREVKAPADGGLRLERTFALAKVPGRVAVCVAGAGRARVYVNGQLVKRLGNHIGKNFIPASIALLDPESMKALHLGSNVLAVELSSGSGPPAGNARVIDVGLFESD